MSATTWTVKRSLGSTALYSGIVSPPDATTFGGTAAEYEVAFDSYSKTSGSVASRSASTSKSALSKSAASYDYEDYLKDVYNADRQASPDDDFDWWNPLDWAGALLDAVAHVVGTVIDGFATGFAWVTAPVLEILAEGFAAAIDAGAALVGTALEVLVQGASEVIEFFTGLDFVRDGNYQPPGSAEEIANMNFFEYIYALTQMNASDLGQQFDLLGDLLNYLDDDDCSGDELPNVDFFDIAYKIGVAVALAAAGALAVGATTLLGGAAGAAIGKLFEGLGLDVGGDLLGFLAGFGNDYHGSGSHYGDRDNFLEHIFGDLLGGFGGGVIGDILGVVLHVAGEIAEPVLDVLSVLVPIAAIGGAVAAGAIALKLAGLVIENRSDGAISGNAFDDIDLDGRQGEFEGLEGIAVVLLNPDGSVAYTKEGEEAIVYTDENGHYCFNNVIRGDYKVGFEVVNGKSFVDKGSSKDKDASDVNQNSGAQTVRVEKEDGSTITVRVKTTDTFKLQWDEHEKHIDAGYEGPNGLIEGRLTVDDDRDNTERNTVKDDNDENYDLGLGGQVVQLLDRDGNVVMEDVTDKDGNYGFRVAVGEYRVKFPDDFDYARKNVGASGENSDVNADGRTDLLTVTDNGTLQNIDASIQLANAEYNAGDDSIRVFEDGDAGSVNLLANDVVTLSPKVELIGNTNTPGGKLSLDSNTGVLTFDPENDFQSLGAGKTTSFDVRYRVTDQSVQSNITVEAESLIDNSDDFRVYASNKASGARGIQLKDWKWDGWVKYDFEGNSGLYDLNLFIQDEDDGQSEVEVEINGKLMGDFELRKDPDGAGNNDGDYSKFVVSGLELKRGDEVKVKIKKDGGELGRFDKMVFSETITEARPATITIEAEDAVSKSGVLDSDDLRVFVSKDASGRKGAHVTSSWLDDDGWLKVKSFEGDSGTYDVIMYIQDEDDGRSDIDIRINGTKYAAFEVAGARDGAGDDNGTFTQFIIADVKLNKGDEIKFHMDRDGDELIRLDKIEFARPYTVQEATATITVEGVNDDPNARNDSDSINEDTFRKYLTNVLNNDSDVDSGEKLRITEIDGSTGATFNNPFGNGGELQKVDGDNGGRFEIRADGRASFFTDGDFEFLGAGQSRTTRVTYTVSDGNGGQDTATVAVKVNGQNDRPDAVDDEIVLPEDATAVGNVLSNDTDPDRNDTLKVTKAGGKNPGANLSVTSEGGRTAKIKIAQNGEAEVDLNGQFLDLDKGEFDTIKVNYEISDGKGGKDTATLTVTVVEEGRPEGDPVANDDSATVNEDQGGKAINLTANDTDPDGDDVEILSIDTTGVIGNVSINGDRDNVSYNPNGRFESLGVGESAVETFTYTVTDGTGRTDEAEVTVTIDGRNDGPDAVNDTFAGPNTKPITGNVLSNDTDPDTNDTLAVLNPGTVTVTSAGGRNADVTINANGQISVDTSNFGDLGVNSKDTLNLTYTVTDRNGGRDTANVTVTVNGSGETVQPLPPEANNDNYTVAEDADLPFGNNVIANDTDPNGDVIRVTSVTGATTASLTNPFGNTGQATTVDGTNGGTFTIRNGGNIYFSTDGDFQSLGRNDSTTTSVTYTLSDPGGLSDTATVTVTVTGRNDGPTAVNDSFSVAEDGNVSGNVLSNDTDPDSGDTLTVSAAGGNPLNTPFSVTSAGGRTATATLNSDGTFSLAPGANFIDLDGGETDTVTLTYTVSDGLATSTASITVTVRGESAVPLQDGDEADTVGEDAGLVTLDPDNVLLNTVSSRVATVEPTNTLDTFDGGDTTGWNQSKTVSLGGEEVLGNFGNGGVARKTFDLDPNADTAKIEFDFYRLDSWDNENFKINLDGKDLFSVKFNHKSGVANGAVVAEETVKVGGTTYTLTMTAEGGNGNKWVSGWADQKFKVEIDIDNPGDTVELALSSTLNQGAGDESWAIDNVAVSTDDAASAQFVSNATPVDLTEELRGTATASASSVGWGGNASKVIDGNTNGDNWVHTKDGANEWVEVDLKDDYALTTIVVTNRGNGDDNVAARLNGAELVVLDANGQETYRSDPISGATKGEVFEFELPSGIEGQFVRMEHSRKFLHVSEIQVFGTEVGAVSGPDGSRLISSENFENGVSGWGTNQTFSNDKMSTVLGQFGQGASVAKTFTVGNADQSVIEFDFLKIDSWDNENAVFSINGVEILSQTISWSTPAGTVYEGGVVNVGGGATAKVTMTAPKGVTQLDDRWATDQVWKVQIVVDNPGTEVTLGVSSTLNQAADDEAWAIDNVNVFAIGDGGTGLTDASATGALARDLEVISVGGTAAGVGTRVAGSDGGFFIIGADGTASFDTAGEFEFLANGESAFTSVNYVVQNAAGDTDGSTYTVTVTGANDGPTANADAGTVGEDGPATSINLTANDTDPDTSDDLEILSVDPSGVTGSVSINPDGDSISYDPNGQFESLGVGETAIETFTYTVTDGNGGRDTATISVTVQGANDAPEGADQGLTVPEDTPLIGVLTGTDVDGDALTFTVDGNPANGTVTINADGTFQYTPNANFNGQDSFDYIVRDTNGAEGGGTIEINVTPVNDRPDAVNDTFMVDEDSTLSPSAPDPNGVVLNVLRNDADIDGPDLRVVSITNGTDTATPAGDPFRAYGQSMIVNGTNGGVFDVRNGGNVSFDPNGAFESLAVGETATTSVTYTIDDGAGDTDTAVITITVEGRNDGPTAVADAATVGEDDTTATVIDLTVNDTDPDASDTLSILSIDTTGTLGTVTDNGDGATVSYDPNGQFESLAAGETATDTFTYTVTDGNGGTSTETVTVTIEGANAAPTAADDAVQIAEDGVAVLDLFADNGNGVDSDPDGDDLVVISAGQGGVPNPLVVAPGSSTASVTFAAVSAGGRTGNVLVTDPGGPLNFAFDPAGGFDDLDTGETDTVTITYTVSDGNGATDTAEVVVTVDGEGGIAGSGTVTTAGSGDRNIVVIVDASNNSVGFADAYAVPDFDGDGDMGTAADYMLSKIVDLAEDLAATDQLSVIPSGFNSFQDDALTVVTFSAGTLNAASGDLAAQQAIFAPIVASYLSFDFTLDWEQSFNAANEVFQTSAGFDENKVIALVNSESTFEDQAGDIRFFSDVEDEFADLTSGDSDADVDILVIDDSFAVPERLAVIDSDGMVDVDAGGFGLSSLLDPAPSVMSSADLIRFSISVDGVEAADIDLDDLTATADGFEFSIGALPDGTEYVATIGLDTDRDGIVDIERSQTETNPGATFSFALDAFVSDQSLIDAGLVGSAAADVLTGDAASNCIYGLGGDDQLFGAGGNDFLDGGAGTDSLTGGAGSDAFVFRKGDGETIITDYELGGVDVIDLEGLAFYGFAGVLSMASQVGDDTVFDFGDGDLLTLNNVDLSMLTEADLCFR